MYAILSVGVTSIHSFPAKKYIKFTNSVIVVLSWYIARSPPQQTQKFTVKLEVQISRNDKTCLGFCTQTQNSQLSEYIHFFYAFSGKLCFYDLCGIPWTQSCKHWITYKPLWKNSSEITFFFGNLIKITI